MAKKDADENELPIFFKAFCLKLKISFQSFALTVCMSGIHAFLMLMSAFFGLAQGHRIRIRMMLDCLEASTFSLHEGQDCQLIGKQFQEFGKTLATYGGTHK